RYKICTNMFMFGIMSIIASFSLIYKYITGDKNEFCGTIFDDNNISLLLADDLKGLHFKNTELSTISSSNGSNNDIQSTTVAAI
ncbi:MAG: hypothetical protein KDH96_08165, partial [Candidatus Riesia sp.]|nr:hypothetical protein [Candidatus Riesia sp.]